MRRTTEQMIEKSINEGYELLAQGTGKYDDNVEEYRRLGYDVRAWYLDKVDGIVVWRLYGKLKVRKPRTSKKAEPKVDYSALTVKDLRKICSEKKIAGYSKLNKEQLIERLSAAC